jgi:multidrug resistance protein
MRINEKDIRESARVSKEETPTEVENDDHSSISTASTNSHSSSEEVQSIHQTLSRNAGLEDGDKTMAHITTTTTNMTTDPRFEVDFEEDGSDNPQDWTMLRKCIVIFFMSFSTLVVVMYSTSYTSGIPGMMTTFGIGSKTVVVLGVTTYLAGLAAGSLILAPLSEMYGRRPVYLISVFMFTVLIIPCALAQNLATVLAIRFFGAIAGSAMISNAPGTVSDIISDDYRALAFSIWSIGPMNGPVVGPVIGGFVFQYMGWRWTNWVPMIGSGVSWFMVLCMRPSSLIHDAI